MFSFDSFVRSSVVAALAVVPTAAAAETVESSYSGTLDGSGVLMLSGSFDLTASGSMLSLPVSTVAASLSDIRWLLAAIFILLLSWATYALLSDYFYSHG